MTGEGIVENAQKVSRQMGCLAKWCGTLVHSLTAVTFAALDWKAAGRDAKIPRFHLELAPSVTLQRMQEVDNK